MFDVKKFCFDNKLSQAAFGEDIGEAQSVVSHMVRGVRKVHLKHIEKLRMKYGDIVDNYRTDGPSAVKPAAMSPYASGTVGDVNVRYSTSHRQGVEDAEIVGEHSPAQRCGDARPLSIDECNELCPARLPYVKGEIVQSRDIDIRQLIESEPQKLEYRTMRQMIGNPDYVQKVITAAMMPLFQPGDLLFIRFLPDDAKLISGAIYLVDTRVYGAMVRQVYLEDNGIYTLHSLNPDFKELHLRRDEIYSISLVARSLRSDFNMPKITPDATEIFKRREAQMDHLLEMHSNAMAEICKQNERMAEERRRQDEERKAQFEQMVAERNRQDRLIDKILGGGDR